MSQWLSRCRQHDYRKPGLYFVTITKCDYIEPLSRLIVRKELGVKHPDFCGLQYTYAGRAVARALKMIPDADPLVEVQQYVIMPDHVHILFRVKEYMPRSLGSVIAVFKINASNQYLYLTNQKYALFNRKFNDQLGLKYKNIDTIFKYIRTNPYRLAVRQAYPEYFSKVREYTICGEKVSAYGNIMLLRNPFKSAVVVHGSDSMAKKDADKARWLNLSKGGGVLVSAFYSKDEMTVREEAIELGGKIILLSNRLLGEREKPTGREFELCSQGRMLILMPHRAIKATNNISQRDSCLRMNALAEKLEATGVIDSENTPLGPS